MTIGLIKRRNSRKNVISDGRRTRTPTSRWYVVSLERCHRGCPAPTSNIRPGSAGASSLPPRPQPQTFSGAGKKEREPSENIEVTASRISRLLKKKEHGSILENRVAELGKQNQPLIKAINKLRGFVVVTGHKWNYFAI